MKRADASMVVPKKKHFRYTQVFNNHFAYRHVVDDHNNFRMMEPCIEKSWRTIKWEKRVFAFVLAILEVNAWLAMRYLFCDLNMKLLDFRTNLACQLVYNPWLEKESAGLEKDDEVVNIKKRKSSRINMDLTHEFCSAPPFGKTFTTDGKWILTDKNAYQKKVCKGEGCKKQVRTYCSCCVGHWMCPQCYGFHMRDVGNLKSNS